MPTVSMTAASDPVEQYGKRWALPPGLLRWAVISQQWEGLEAGCGQALAADEPVSDWEPFVTKSLPHSGPAD